MPLLAGPLRSTGAGESATSRFDSGHVGLAVSVASGGRQAVQPVDMSLAEPMSIN
jgi:hypothetical protein